MKKSHRQGYFFIVIGLLFVLNLVLSTLFPGLDLMLGAIFLWPLLLLSMYFVFEGVALLSKNNPPSSAEVQVEKAAPLAKNSSETKSEKVRVSKFGKKALLSNVIVIPLIIGTNWQLAESCGGDMGCIIYLFFAVVGIVGYLVITLMIAMSSDEDDQLHKVVGDAVRNHARPSIDPSGFVVIKEQQKFTEQHQNHTQAERNIVYKFVFIIFTAITIIYTVLIFINYVGGMTHTTIVF